MLEVKYTLKDTSISAPDLAKWVKQRVPSFTAPDCLYVARCLIKGEEWSPPIDKINEYLDVGPCSMNIIPDPDNHWEVFFAEEKVYSDLLKDGAAGNAQAAIEYCKAVIEGKVSRGGAIA
jgi:hypothetical protein